MADHTDIAWTDATWNPASGCTRISEGCDHCYIARQPPLRMNRRRFDRPGTGATTGVLLHEARLTQPLHWRRPRRIFVNSLSDLFHDDIPTTFIARVWAVMALADQHTYQILTKRPARMRALLTSPGFQAACQAAVDELLTDDTLRITARQRAAARRLDWRAPLPNVWLGVSAENQRWAERRILILLRTPAARRFVSAEPLLEPVSLFGAVRTLGSERGHGLTASFVHTGPTGCCARFHGLDWVIAGGESGPGARPAHPDWFRQLRDECERAGTAFFFKQWGAYAPLGPVYDPRDPAEEAWDETDVAAQGSGCAIEPAGGVPVTWTRDRIDHRHQPAAGAWWMRRGGAHANGRHLDGREHLNFPTPHTPPAPTMPAGRPKPADPCDEELLKRVAGLFPPRASRDVPDSVVTDAKDAIHQGVGR